MVGRDHRARRRERNDENMKLKMALLMMCGIVLAALSLTAETETVGDYTWTYHINGDTAEIYNSDYNAAISPKPNGAVTIPSTLGGKPVTSIGSSAFRNCSSLTSVTIPDSVMSIGSYAFSSCSSLTNVTIGNGVTSIGEWAFYGCSSLTSVTIPDSVTSIGSDAFCGCSGLTSVTIGNGVTIIGYEAFGGCNSLTSVTIPDSVTSIGDRAFYGCSSLTSVTIGDGVTSIGDYAFSGCSGLTSVTIGDGVTSIGDYAFSGCSGLTSVEIPDGIISIEEGAFSGCIELTSVTIPDSVTSIGYYAFSGCSGLTSVTIGDCVTSIGYYAFSGCSGLTSVTIGNGVTSIGFGAFSGCSDSLFDTRTISGVKLVDGWVVGYTDSPYNYYYLDLTGIRGIGDRAFYGCSGLTGVTIGDSVMGIGDEAFEECRRLKRVMMNGDCPAIYYSAFSDVAYRCIVQLPRGNETYTVDNGRWQGMLVEYYIRFVDEIGAVNPNATIYTVEDHYDFLPPTAVAGWDFLGWDLSGVYNQTGDITVTAQWARSASTVTFDIGAHGTKIGGGTLTQTVAWGEPAVSPIIMADAGWVFIGWDADISQITEPITVTAQYERAPLSIETASGLDRVWTIGGDVPWYAEWSDTAHDGVNHLHSGAIGDNQESWVEAVVTNAGIVSFWWKASSEAYRGVAYDKAVFSVDGVEVASIGGEADWTNVTYNIESRGSHSLRWTYSKDESDYGGEDCAWLDEVQYLREMRVTFEDGGATGGGAPAAMTVAEGLEITLPDQGSLTWPQHRFAGWRINDEIFAPGTPYALGNDDVLFTAAWEEKRVSAPSIDVASWYDTERTVVTMECGTAGATIHYTLDGSTPTTESAIYSGSFELTGSATIKAIAVLDDHFDSDVVSAESVRAPWTPGECLNVSNCTFTIGGDATWFRDMSVAHDGDAAMRSGAICDEQTSWIEMSVAGAGTLTFWWKVSSEAYKSSIFDYARFTVDGVTAVADIGGEIGWRSEAVAITGSGVHALRWAYVKDSQDKNGFDCVWLDEVVWTPDDPLPPIDVAATDDDVSAIVAGLSDDRLSGKISNVTEYTSFRSWVDGNGLSHSLVKDAPNAWLSYALDVPGLMARATPLASEDIVIESIETSSSATGAFDLVVDIADAEIGEGTTSARLAEALGVEGAAELDESAFSSDGLTVNFSRTADGKAKATVMPDGAPPAFFLRVKVQ